MTVYEGSIVTCDAAGGVHRYLVEDGGTIRFVGDSLPAVYSSFPTIVLGEKSLLPAFADTHIHFMSWALFSAGLDVRAATTIAEVKTTIADFVRTSRTPVVLGFGVSPHCVAEKRLITRTDIDEVSGGRPVFIVKYDGHAAVANSALLARLDPRLKALRGFDADSGLMTQEAFFRVTDFVTGKVSLPATLGNMLSAVDGMAAMGIGSIHSVTGVGFPMDLDVGLESLFARGLRNAVNFRLFFQTMDVSKVLKRELPRIGGCFATALDGCFGSVDAALNEPYEAAAGLSAEAARGILYNTDEKVTSFCIEANRKGLQIEVHAIGDAAFDQAVAAIEAALDDFPRLDHRHTIIHACLPTTRGLEICARRGIAIALQPAFLDWDQEPLEYLSSIMGDRAMRLSPLRAMQDLGIVLAGGSDAPCTLPNPLEGIHAACNHYVPEQSLNIQEALNLYTRNAAFIGFDDRERGSLEAGKIADMIVLDKNPLTQMPQELRNLRVESLILAGKPYKPGQGSAELVLKGLFNRSRKI